LDRLDRQQLNLSYMKPRCSNLVRFLSVLCLAIGAVAPLASAQPRPSLGLRFSAGQPTLSLTGTAGTVYSIQYATGLSPTDLWVDRTLLQSQGASGVWNDPSAPTPSQRFYRAVSVPAPADTNLVFIQPGTFTMGSPTNEVDRVLWEGPQTAVTISRGFWMGRYEVTQAEYEAVMGDNPSRFTGDPNRPVETVSWFDATAYCDALTERERAAGRTGTNSVYRLPTEAEWEYACRAGTTTRFSYGDDPGYPNLTAYAWYGDNSGGTTHPVGQKLPNPWGLYDMHGNVFEWCQDCWSDNLPGGIAVDPQGPASGSLGVARGGDWGFWLAGDWYCRSAFRNDFDPDIRGRGFGFRVVLAPGQP
jgi:formylglycine-generating enzyme required for sulfatase activity